LVLRARTPAFTQFQFLAQEPLTPTLPLVCDLLTDGFGFQKGGVVTRMRKCTALIDFHDARGDRIQKITVMRDKHDCA
jgi:hypothetical protein